MNQNKILDTTKIPTQPYPELRYVLHTFVERLQTELEDNLLGFYLVGSLSSGDFDLDSDVDFLAVIQENLGDETISTLEKIMTGMHSMGFYPAQHMEGSFITLSDLKDWGTVRKKKLVYFDNGSTRAERSIHDNQWHVRWILREGGAALLGPPPKTLLPPIPLDKMFTETREALFEILKLLEEQIDEPLTYINSRFGQSFAVLSVCRFLQTLDTGRVESKKAAVKWARQALAPEWIGIIDQAWLERQGVRFCVKIRQRAEQKNLDETLKFIRYAIEVDKGRSS
ncbi:aminoglycoside adenylyltransferase domain-containing protein [Chloroflexota bacterium]